MCFFSMQVAGNLPGAPCGTSRGRTPVGPMGGPVGRVSPIKKQIWKQEKTNKTFFWGIFAF